MREDCDTFEEIQAVRTGFLLLLPSDRSFVCATCTVLRLTDCALYNVRSTDEHNIPSGVAESTFQNLLVNNFEKEKEKSGKSHRLSSDFLPRRHAVRYPEKTFTALGVKNATRYKDNSLTVSLAAFYC